MILKRQFQILFYSFMLLSRQPISLVHLECTVYFILRVCNGSLQVLSVSQHDLHTYFTEQLNTNQCF